MRFKTQRRGKLTGYLLTAVFFAGAWTTASHAQGPPIVDGFLRDPATGVVENQYTLKGITYTLDSTTGQFSGILYSYEDPITGNVYLGFEQSVALNDNTYGANAIDWDFRRQGHTLKDLDKSDHLALKLYDCAGNLVFDGRIDYVSAVKSGNTILGYDNLCVTGGDGSVISGNAADILACSSSMDWNLNWASCHEFDTPTSHTYPETSGNCLYPDRLIDSPQRVPTNTFESGTMADPAYPWIYPLAYEFAVAGSAFAGGGGWCGDIVIAESHNSPIKQGTNPIPIPALVGSKLSDPPSGSKVTSGQTITYSLSFTNVGTTAHSNVVITDVVDASLTNAAPLDGGTCSGNPCGAGDTVSWNIGTFAANQTIEVSWTAEVTFAESFTIYNTATLASPDLPAPFATNTTEHSCRAAANDATCDGIDDDCDGQVDEDYVALDTSCGVGACASTGTTSCVNGEVIDSCVTGDPNSDDTSCDNVDNDCNGSVDDGFVSENTTCGVGACAATGSTSCVEGTVIDSCTAGTPANDDVTCDNIDNDCNGTVDDGYVPVDTTCGVGACAATGNTSCVDGTVTDSCQRGTEASDNNCNNIDDDCDGVIDDDYAPSTTSCGVGACASTGRTSCTNGIESDSCTARTPAADDSLCDGVDNDCDGSTDEDYVQVETSCGVGACGSIGTTSCENGEVHNSCLPGTPAESDATCDNIDNDCNGSVDSGYTPVSTNCGVGVCASTGHTSCEEGIVVDSCEPGTPTGADDNCNGLDDDCDGTTDEHYVAPNTSCGEGECQSSGQLVCVNGATVDTCTPGAAGSDANCDGLDNDCDGLIDEDFVETQTSCGIGACAATGHTSCVNGTVQDGCTAGTPAADDSLCDGIDNDCDGAVDEEYASLATSCGVGACASTGSTSCINGEEQDSCSEGTPAADDSVCDGIDSDCDGATDEEYTPPATSCGVGACASEGQLVCVDGSKQDTCAAGTPAAEVCDGTDNDCNGVVDEGFDIDCDGIGDCFDDCPSDPWNDADGDGVCGDVDNCPDVANGADGDNQADSDNDGIGDSCDACPGDASNDADGDGVCGDVDNCPSVANQGQLDSNNNGIGNACELTCQ
jgi:uncharacterized repeat protein (TIGR01451 family)